MSDLRIGTLVRFAHEKNGGPVHRVTKVMQDGMVELNYMHGPVAGYFAPHLFVIADDIGDIPPSRDNDELLPCPFCGGAAERIDIEDGNNASGSYVHCSRCDACSNVEFEFKENFVSNWNRRTPAESGLTLDGKAIALFRAWADRIPDPAEAFEAWEGMSMADQGEWRRRVIEYEAILAECETT